MAAVEFALAEEFAFGDVIKRKPIKIAVQIAAIVKMALESRAIQRKHDPIGMQRYVIGPWSLLQSSNMRISEKWDRRYERVPPPIKQYFQNFGLGKDFLPILIRLSVTNTLTRKNDFLLQNCFLYFNFQAKICVHYKRRNDFIF